MNIDDLQELENELEMKYKEADKFVDETFDTMLGDEMTFEYSSLVLAYRAWLETGQSIVSLLKTKSMEDLK